MTPDLAFLIGVSLIPYVLGWLILLFKPSWTFLFAFTGAMAAFALIGLLHNADPYRAGLWMLIRGAVFMAVGGPIVALRLWIRHIEEGARAARRGNRNR